jgi:hypothetical protein
LRSYRKLVYYAQAAINDRDPNFLNDERYITPQPRECHNDWLEDLVELGIAGATIRWVLIGSVLWVGFSVMKGDLMVVFMITALLSICAHAAFFFSLRVPASGFCYGWCSYWNNNFSSVVSNSYDIVVNSSLLGVNYKAICIFLLLHGISEE